MLSASWCGHALGAAFGPARRAGCRRTCVPYRGASAVPHITSICRLVTNNCHRPRLSFRHTHNRVSRHALDTSPVCAAPAAARARRARRCRHRRARQRELRRQHDADRRHPGARRAVAARRPERVDRSGRHRRLRRRGRLRRLLRPAGRRAAAQSAGRVRRAVRLCAEDARDGRRSRSRDRQGRREIRADAAHAGRRDRGVRERPDGHAGDADAAGRQPGRVRRV